MGQGARPHSIEKSLMIKMMTTNHIVSSVSVSRATVHAYSNPPRQFLRDKVLLKKKLREMLIDQIIKFEMRGPGPLVVHELLKLFSFIKKQKSSWQILE